jgi:hypothetical protein
LPAQLVTCPATGTAPSERSRPLYRSCAPARLKPVRGVWAFA